MEGKEWVFIFWFLLPFQPMSLYVCLSCQQYNWEYKASLEVHMRKIYLCFTQPLSSRLRQWHGLILLPKYDFVDWPEANISLHLAVQLTPLLFLLWNFWTTGQNQKVRIIFIRSYLSTNHTSETPLKKSLSI